MPFRERAKNLFKTKSRGSSLSTTNTNESSPEGRERWPSNVYKPGEPMPRPKYRAPPKKEHKDKLEAFNFADAWRKKSFQSTYSPGGTRVSSRRTSFLSLGKKSALSRNASVTSEDTEKSGLRSRGEGLGAAVATRLQTEPEQEGDDDVTNVGLSRVQSREKPAISHPKTAEARQPNGIPNGLHKTMSTAHDHQPFTEHDLAIAMQRTRLEVPAHS